MHVFGLSSSSFIAQQDCSSDTVLGGHSREQVRHPHLPSPRSFQSSPIHLSLCWKYLHFGFETPKTAGEVGYQQGVLNEPLTTAASSPLRAAGDLVHQ